MSLRARYVAAILLLAMLELFAWRAHANVSLIMSVTPVWDPVRAATSPLVIPGARLAVEIEVANGAAVAIDGGSLTVTAPIPDDASLIVAGPGARFETAPGSGLTIDFRAPGDPGDDVEFSADGGLTFDYAPTAGANGIDGAVTHVRFRCRGSLFGGERAQILYALALVGSRNADAN